jgi:hypothetical protein
MNTAYKEVLFATGQEQNKSLELMATYKVVWYDFHTKYHNSPIKPYSDDKNWENSLDIIQGHISSADDLINQNKLKDAHVKLEEIRKEWQNIFTRNNVTMLGFYLTEYHDLMEKAIEESDEKDYVSLVETCEKLNSAWGNVLSTQVNLGESDLLEYNTKLVDNTNNLKKLCDAVANKDDNSLKEASGKLKGLFIPLYLKYG